MESVMSGNALDGASLVFALLLAYAVAVTLIHKRTPPPAVMKRIALEIRQQVESLVEEGCSLLLPQDSDGVIARLLISIEDDNAVIEQCSWGVGDRLYSDTRLQYIITANGQVTRRIIGRDLAKSDRVWCHGCLTQRRLEQLRSFTSSYSPRREMSRHL